MKRTPGVDISTGSLGQGLSTAVGMAIAAKRDDRNLRVFVMLGDGECNEGQIWEAAQSANKYRLDNLVVLVDNNALQNDGICDELMPADYWSARKLIDAAYHYPGPVYLRFTRDPIPVIHQETDTFEIGHAREVFAGTDATIIANGDVMSLAMQAVTELREEGISVRPIDMHTIKPLGREAVLRAIHETERIVTIEDHNILNGLGSAVAEVKKNIQSLL